MKRIRVSVHPLAAFGMFLLLFMFPGKDSFAVVSSVLLHETGHAVAARLAGQRLESLRVVPAGITLGFSAPKSYRSELLVAAAGPFMSFAYAAASYGMPEPMGNRVRVVTLLLGTINLLPVKMLDGGQILSALVFRFFLPDLAQRVLDLFAAAFWGSLWILSLYVLFYSGANFTLLLFCAYLFSCRMIKKT